jgi:hypothetical protein
MCKNKIKLKDMARITGLLLAAGCMAADLQAADIEWKSMMTVAERKRNAQGQLQPLQSYDETIRRGMEFLLKDHLKWFKGPPENLLDEKGQTQMPWVYYSNLQQDGTPFAGAVDGFVSYPAFHHALLIRTFIGYSKYANDQRPLKEAVKLADWNIAHSTPADWPYAGLPYSTFEAKKPGGFRDGSGLMPDKAAIMALAYLDLHEAGGEVRFRQAAESIGKSLSLRQREDGTWPFRMDPKTEAVIEDYSSSVIYAVMLFEKLDKLNGNHGYQACRDRTWNWLLNGPIKTKEFRGFYEDIPASKDGRTNYDCLDTIRYLLANRTDTNGYLEMAKDLNAWIEKTFMDKIKGFEPAEGIREQLQCNVVMGIHSLNWASMLLELSKATGDEALRQRAIQTANYITYYLQPDNRIVVGFQYNQWWYSCHAGVVLYLLDFAASPMRTEQGVKDIRVTLPPRPSAVIMNIGRVLERQINQRCDTRVSQTDEAALTVELVLDPGIGAEGFRIEDRRAGGVRIVGNDERGLVAGVGKFLRTSRYDKGGFTAGTWRGTSVPTRQARGIYFATHFHNYYHEAPVEEIGRYVEDLALWGLNELVIWYDAHHFNGFDDPKAAEFRKRLHTIMSAAKRIGMDVSLLVIGNEAYGNSPATIRAAPGGGRGGYYPCAVCPSNPEGMKYILQILGEQFDWAADLKPRSVWIWPYDQGGCGCAECKPWGSKGFMKCVEEVGKLARQKLPGTKIMLSTWYMDKNELAAVMKQLGERKELADGLVNEGNVLPSASGLGGVDQKPGGAVPVLRQDLPVVGFPEISMYGTFPWGGFGATPLTGRAQGQWNAQKNGLAGGYPYSEGIYEDITKVVYSQFYWNDRPAAETVKEYIAFEFSPDVVEGVAGVIKTLEQNHHMRWWPGKLEGVPLEMNWFPSKGAKPQADPGAEEAYATVQRVDEKLTPQAKKAWRWRQLYLRALLDSELKTSGGKPNDKCNEAFAELIKIYHAENAIGTVRPPLPKDWKGDK